MKLRTSGAVALASIGLLATGAAGGTGSSAGSEWAWEGVHRIIAIGDVHGHLDKLEPALRATGLIGDGRGWSGGTTHLVLLGDLIDRGPDDRPVLDLVQRLQGQAEAAGGRVHVLLGNHEVMNMTRDFRYVSAEAFAEFAGEEPEAARGTARERFVNGAEKPTLARRAFEESFPQGYFARREAFAPAGEYGAWLIEQPVAVKINGFVFVHGGLRPEIAALGIDEINRRVRRELLAFAACAEALEHSVQDVADWDELYATAQRLGGGTKPLPPAPGSPNRRQAARGLVYLVDEGLMSSAGGPLWYRGLSLENERVERAPLADVLDTLGARAIVVGHTPTSVRAITSRFNGAVFRTDVALAYGGKPEALVIEGGEVRALDALTLSTAAPYAELPQGQKWPQSLADLPRGHVEQLLARARVDSVLDRSRDGRHVKLVELKRDGLVLRGVFQFVSERPPAGTPPQAYNPRRFQHELAAYRLDRLLELGLVPVVVARTIDRTPGALTVFSEDAIDLVTATTYGWLAADDLWPQIRRAIVFTALVGARERHDAMKMLLPGPRRILVGDHSKGFPLSTEVEDVLTRPVLGRPAPACAPLDAPLELGLRSLERSTLRKALKRWLTREQIEALLIRRDRILESCAGDRPRARR